MISIRPIARQDKPAWAALWRRYLAFYETTLPDDVYDSAFDRLISGRDHEFCGFLACEDDVPVGLTHYLFHRHCWKIEDVCYLQDLYVDPECRGGGAAAALIEAVYAAADAAGAPAVYWMTQNFNTGGRRLYERVGKPTPFIRFNR